MLLAIAVVVGITVILIVSLPFFVGEGGVLQAASSEQSREQLEVLKEAILRRYIEDEEAAVRQAISPRIWRQRRLFLTNRYIDTVRRLDYLQHMAQESHAQEKEGK